MRFLFISANRTWGGSEELWSAAAAALAEDGHEVIVFKPRIDPSEPRIQRLRQLGCRMRDLARFGFLPSIYPLLARLSFPLTHLHEVVRLRLALAFTHRPDLVVISQGGNLDGFLLGNVCRRMKLPYVLISQKATDLYWPPDVRRGLVRSVYEDARAVYFVSERNRVLTEEQLGVALPHAQIVRNPFLVPWEPRNDWPNEQAGIRLACIGRLYPMEKGQDLLLRVVARARWRERPLAVTFYGEGIQREGLEAMARHLRLTSVTFAGFVRDVAAIWDDHHGLILPSRCEGLPLVLVEAMLSGRVPIVTDVAGNSELIDDGVTGFLARAATEDALDEAMDRAWQRRDQWRAIGGEGAARIRTRIPRDPARELAERLRAVAGESPDR